LSLIPLITPVPGVWLEKGGLAFQCGVLGYRQHLAPAGLRRILTSALRQFTK
jgi:hypothetical protein